MTTKKSGKEDLMSILIQNLRNEIIPLFEQAVGNDNVTFPNPHLVHCWKVMSCKMTSCSLYGKEEEALRCWQASGTYCGGTPQGNFVQKFGSCKKCPAFKQSCPSIVEEIGEHFNNMVYLLKKRKHDMVKKQDQIESLNRELLTALEQLDTKNRHIQEIMITDKLTGLYNRYHLVTVLEDETTRSQRYHHPLAVLMIDIDKFKSFNDSYGHLAGDQMLAFIGRLIKESIRKFDRAFRFGGEEFVVVLPETDHTMAYVVAERLRKAFAEKTFIVSSKEKMTNDIASRTISIGHAQFEGESSIEELLNQADNALYAAKDKGGNLCVRYEENK